MDPQYEDVLGEIYSFLKERSNVAVEGGVDPGKIIVDPGIGFGKTKEHNLAILNNVRTFRGLGFPVLVGPSRKRFIGDVLGNDVDHRLHGTVSAAVTAYLRGASILRVHDVKECSQALSLAGAIWKQSY